MEVMINWIIEPPGWAILPLILAGLLLIWWDVARRRPQVSVSDATCAPQDALHAGCQVGRINHSGGILEEDDASKFLESLPEGQRRPQYVTNVLPLSPKSFTKEDREAALAVFTLATKKFEGLERDDGNDTDRDRRSHV